MEIECPTCDGEGCVDCNLSGELDGLAIVYAYIAGRLADSVEFGVVSLTEYALERVANIASGLPRRD